MTLLFSTLLLWDTNPTMAVSSNVRWTYTYMVQCKECKEEGREHHHLRTPRAPLQTHNSEASHTVVSWWCIVNCSCSNININSCSFQLVPQQCQLNFAEEIEKVKKYHLYSASRILESVQEVNECIIHPNFRTVSELQEVQLHACKRSDVTEDADFK